MNKLYVIPDIHGADYLLGNICGKILPLDETDKIIFLGDYIDRHQDSYKVVDRCIDIQNTYGDRAIFLMGNHELMLLEVCTKENKNRKFSLSTWLSAGGLDTLVGYMERAKIKGNPMEFPGSKIKKLLGNHFDFFANLQPYYEIEDYIFVHAGINLALPLGMHDTQTLTWDRNLLTYVLTAIKNKRPLGLEKNIITGHNVTAQKEPIVYENFMMLDCGSPKQLLFAEVRSKEFYMSTYDGILPYTLSEYKEKPSLFRRV